MDKANYEGYSKHARMMSKRVRMRKSHPELTAIDNIIIDITKEKLESKDSISLLDAGCGTGERLKMILERGKIDIARVKCVGVDFCDPLVNEAKTKRVNGKILYEKAYVENLLNFKSDFEFDIIICLFSVLNNVGKEYLKVIQNLSNLLQKDGLLIFDFIHPEAAKHLFREKLPELETKYGLLGNNEFYYKRSFDNSFGKAFVFSLEDFQVRYKDKPKIKDTNLLIKAVYNINNFKTNKGKYSTKKEYILNDGVFVENNNDKSWKNSILVVSEKF